MILLKLDKPFEISDHVRTICLDTLLDSDLYAPGKKCVVAGWGSTTRRGKFYSCLNYWRSSKSLTTGAILHFMLLMVMVHSKNGQAHEKKKHLFFFPRQNILLILA